MSEPHSRREPSGCGFAGTALRRAQLLQRVQSRSRVLEMPLEKCVQYTGPSLA